MSDLFIKIEVDTAEATEKISILNMQVDRLLSKLEKCNQLCDGCKIVAEVKLSGADLVGVQRNHDYRATRTE